MLLFEILSGSRPFREHRSAADIKKAIRRGVRPCLGDMNTQLPRLEHMMRSCWHELPEHRPSAEQILNEMNEPSYLCQCRLMPSPEKGVLEKVTTVCGLLHPGTRTRIWELTTWLEFASSANQHPKSTIKKKSPQTFAHLLHLLLHLPMCPPCLYNLVILTIGESWFLLLMRLGAAYWMLETETSLFELSEVFQ